MLKDVSRTYSGPATVVIGGATYDITGDVTVSFAKMRFQDVYEKPIVAGLGATYGLSPESEVFGSVRVVYARGRSNSGGGVSGAGTLNGTPISGDFTRTVTPSDYKSFGIDAGYRRFFPQGGAVTPYLGALVGVQTIDQMDIKHTVADVSSKARIYDASITPSVGLQVGVAYEAKTGASIGLETGLRYDGKRKDNDKDFGPSFRSINDTGGRFSIPVSLTGRIQLKPENLK